MSHMKAQEPKACRLASYLFEVQGCEHAQQHHPHLFYYIVTAGNIWAKRLARIVIIKLLLSFAACFYLVYIGIIIFRLLTVS